MKLWTAYHDAVLDTVTAVAVQVRCERPTREMVNDRVQLQLMRQESLLQAYLARLNTAMKAADANLSRLERCTRKLQADLNDKVTW